MKKAIAILIAVVMIFACFCTTAVSAAEITETNVPGSVIITNNDITYTADKDSTFIYRVYMTTPEVIENGQFYITYPQNLINVYRYSIPNTPGYMINYQTNITDLIKFNFSNTSGCDLTTEKVLIEIVFEVVGEGNGAIAFYPEVVSNLKDESVINQTKFREEIEDAAIYTPTEPGVSETTEPDETETAETGEPETTESDETVATETNDPATTEPDEPSTTVPGESTTEDEDDTNPTESVIPGTDATESPTTETDEQSTTGPIDNPDDTTAPTESGESTEPTSESDSQDTTPTKPEVPGTNPTKPDATNTDPTESEAPSTAPTESTPAPTQPSTPAPTKPTTPKPSATQPVKPATNLGKGASGAAVEAAILAMKNDSDPKGSTFNLLQVKNTKTTNKSIKLSYKKPSGTKKFVIYGAKCGSDYKVLKTTTAKSININKLKKGTYYKFLVVALDKNGKVVATSKTIHVATKNGKNGNPSKVKITNASSAKSVKKGTNLTLKVKVTAANGVTVKNHRKVKFESTKPSVVKVTANGKITAKKKGTATIYAYAQNGVMAKVKIKVN